MPLDNLHMPYEAAVLAQKDSANGKKTMKAYLWMVCGAEYDAQNS